MLVSDVLESKEAYVSEFPYICRLTQKQLITVLSHLVSAEELEEKLLCIAEGEYESSPKMVSPPKPLIEKIQYKTNPIRVRSTGEVIRPVGRAPKNVVILEVETREEALLLAGRKVPT